MIVTINHCIVTMCVHQYRSYLPSLKTCNYTVLKMDFLVRVIYNDQYQPTPSYTKRWCSSKSCEGLHTLTPLTCLVETKGRMRRKLKLILYLLRCNLLREGKEGKGNVNKQLKDLMEGKEKE